MLHSPSSSRRHAVAPVSAGPMAAICLAPRYHGVGVQVRRRKAFVELPSSSRSANTQMPVCFPVLPIRPAAVRRRSSFQRGASADRQMTRDVDGPRCVKNADVPGQPVRSLRRGRPGQIAAEPQHARQGGRAAAKSRSSRSTAGFQRAARRGRRRLRASSANDYVHQATVRPTLPRHGPLDRSRSGAAAATGPPARFRGTSTGSNRVRSRKSRRRSGPASSSRNAFRPGRHGPRMLVPGYLAEFHPATGTRPVVARQFGPGLVASQLEVEVDLDPGEFIRLDEHGRSRLLRYAGRPSGSDQCGRKCASRGENHSGCCLRIGTPGRTAPAPSTTREPSPTAPDLRRQCSSCSRQTRQTAARASRRPGPPVVGAPARASPRRPRTPAQTPSRLRRLRLADASRRQLPAPPRVGRNRILSKPQATSVRVRRSTGSGLRHDLRQPNSSSFGANSAGTEDLQRLRLREVIFFPPSPGDPLVRATLSSQSRSTSADRSGTD